MVEIANVNDPIFYSSETTSLPLRWIGEINDLPIFFKWMVNCYQKNFWLATLAGDLSVESKHSIISFRFSDQPTGELKTRTCWLGLGWVPPLTLRSQSLQLPDLQQKKAMKSYTIVHSSVSENWVPFCGSASLSSSSKSNSDSRSSYSTFSSNSLKSGANADQFCCRKAKHLKKEFNRYCILYIRA